MQPTHEIVVENETNIEIKFLVLWPNGTSSNVIILTSNNKINLCTKNQVEGHSEIFFKQGNNWYHQEVDDYICPNINTKSFFKIQPQSIDLK
jgi:hypothetical protein